MNDLGPDDVDKERMLHRGGHNTSHQHAVFSRQKVAPSNPFAAKATTPNKQTDTLKSLFTPQTATAKKPPASASASVDAAEEEEVPDFEMDASPPNNDDDEDMPPPDEPEPEVTVPPTSTSKKDRRVSFGNLPPLSPERKQPPSTPSSEKAAHPVKLESNSTPEASTSAHPLRPTFTRAPKSSSPMNASGWQSVCALEEEEKPSEHQPTVGSHQPTDGMQTASGLPVDREGNLPFFFLDAFEDPSIPGKVFLFGKVKRILK